MFNPSEVIEIFKFIGESFHKLLDMKTEDRNKTAKILFSLSKVFDEYPAAYKNGTEDERIKLASKTQGIIDALKSDEAFTQCLGKQLADKFIITIQLVQNWKELLTPGYPDNENRIQAIIKASGYIEGYATVLAIEGK